MSFYKSQNILFLSKQIHTLKRRPCTFGQSLGRPIVRSISHFFWSTKEKIVQYQIFFVHSLEFFVQSFFENVVLVSLVADQMSSQFLIFLKKTGQKFQESEQKRSETGQIVFWSTKKNEK